MPRAVGLDAGEFEVKAVELDGSYRKPRLTRMRIEAAAHTDHVAASQAHATEIAESAMAALKGAGLSRDDVRLGFPCREAVLRTLDVPFKGQDAIRRVIKFESEGAIHSHNVDDMVVDFHPIAEGEGTTRVIVAAVPKDSLRSTLQALEQLGLEPETVDLDTMALYRVADWCGAFEPFDGDGAGDGDGEHAVVPADVATASAPCRLVLDLGARSIRILVVKGGQLVDMRALRLGADAVAEDVATRTGVDIDQARSAVRECLASGGDWREPSSDVEEDDIDDDDAVVLADDDAALVEVDEAAPAVAQVGYQAVTAARDRYLMRLKRELTRFITSIPNVDRIEAVWLTGGGGSLPGVDEVLGEVFSCPLHDLDVLSRLRHDLDEDEVAEVGPRLAVAVGLALGNLGGPRGFNFRQEDLAFTRGFDRIKFPLAIACMLALFLSVLYAAHAYTELRHLRAEYGELHQASTEKSGRRGLASTKASFFGHVGFLVNPAAPLSTGKVITKDEHTALLNRLIKADTFKRLAIIRSELQAKLKSTREKFGQFTEFRLSSGLGVLAEASEVLRNLESQLGRFLVEKVTLKLPYRKENRTLTLVVVLRDDENSTFREKVEVLTSTLTSYCTDPDLNEESSFASANVNPGRTFPGGEAGAGAFYTVEIKLKPEADFPVFPKKGGA